MEGDRGSDLINKRFVTESELEERRKRRQEEWEKVRKADDPEECPEEVYDPRSLYEKLQEQKEQKQQEYEEQFKFKNMVRGLDEDETNFLNEVSRKQQLIEEQRRDEEMKELNEYRSALARAGASTNVKKESERKTAMKAVENKGRFSQAKLLAGAVKHRSSESSNRGKKLKLDPDHDRKHKETSSHDHLGSSSVSDSVVHCPSASVCIGILPGLGVYSGSSDSASSSDSEGTINNTGKIVSSIFRTNTYLEAP
ncbi:PSME3-interacting protein [Microcaecilia unicolor]|uniref:PSME3-interacting protein n=1 Tax=Microcaecilia unicolor TaxID=1415580 RepID=A0A6P7XVX1_9AMPH|nr:PSME3-interacting protein [Microcaecilia unicolor]